MDCLQEGCSWIGKYLQLLGKSKTFLPGLAFSVTPYCSPVKRKTAFYSSWHKTTRQMWLKVEVGEGIDYPEAVNITGTAQLHY